MKMTIEKQPAVIEQQYVVPEIEIIEIAISQNILGGSATLPGMDDGGNAW